MNPRHPVNPALKEEGRVRTAHWLEGRSGDACVSSLAGSSRENPGQREGTRRTVEGCTGASRAAKQEGRSRVLGGARERPPEAAPSRSPSPEERPPKEAPSRLPIPEGANELARIRIRSPH